MTSATGLTPGQPLPDAWAQWCERLKVLGAQIAGDAYPQDDRTRAEGYRALCRQLVVALQMEVEAADTRFPEFVRHEDPWTQWGGPNPDNVYLRATIDPRETYRVWADVRGLREAIFSLHEGDMHLGEFGVHSERTLETLALDGDSLEITISPNEHPGNWMPSPPDARLFAIRVYFDDWDADALPTFHIERVAESLDRPPPPTSVSVARGLDRAINWVERSVPFWDRYIKEAMAATPANVVSPARSTPGGAENLSYGAAIWDLPEDSCLVITSQVPHCRYWGWTIHTAPWFDSGDFANRQTSISGRRLHIDGDGLVRIVLAHGDPRTLNWIDTEQRQRGMLVYRIIGATEAVEPNAELIPLSEVRQHLPSDHPHVDPVTRAAMLRRRRESIARRLR